MANLYRRWLGIYSVIAALSFTPISRSQPLAVSYIQHPPDILTYFAVRGNGYSLKANSLPCQYDKQPNLIFAVGRYHKTALSYVMTESKNAFQNSALQLYSFGGGYRWLSSARMLGGYAFLDTIFKEHPSLWYTLNLCNLNLGLESTFSNQYQLIVNIYIPLRSYDYSYKNCDMPDTQGHRRERGYIITQAYYLESGNYGLDTNLRKTFSLGKHAILVNGGFYIFYDQYKKIRPEGLYTIAREPRYIIGGVFGLNWQWHDAVSLHYKITYDTVKRLSITSGIQWKISTYSPANLAHQRLWLPLIERHLSPLFYPEKINTTVEKSAFHRKWLQQCEIAYQEQESELQTIKAGDKIIHHETRQHLFEFLAPEQGEQESMLRKISRPLHTDRSELAKRSQFAYGALKIIVLGKNFHELYDRTMKNSMLSLIKRVKKR